MTQCCFNKQRRVNIYLLDRSFESLRERGGSCQSAVVGSSANEKRLFEVEIHVLVLMIQDTQSYVSWSCANLRKRPIQSSLSAVSPQRLSAQDIVVYGFTLLSYVLVSREHDINCILIKSEINKPHLQTCHIRIDCPIKKRGFSHIVAGRGFDCTSLPSLCINTLDTLQRNWFLCLSERVVNYPLSWRHKKRLQREIRSRLDLRYGRFFTDISNEWLIISTDLSNSWVWRHINCNSFAQQTAMKFDSFHQTFGTIALH